MRPTQKLLHRAPTFLLIGGFVGLLWMPLVDWCFHLDHSPVPNENRALAQSPSFSVAFANPREFFSQCEAYYRDHFGFRNRLVRWSNRWKNRWFKESTLSAVTTGAQGWLFFTGDYMLDNYLGQKHLSDADLEHWKQLLEKRRDWETADGAKYIFVVTPDKHSIYPEYLPAWLVKNPKNPAPDKLDQFFAYMKTHSTVP